MGDDPEWNAGRFRVPAGGLEECEEAEDGEGIGKGCSTERLGGGEERADEDEADEDEGAWRGDAIAAYLEETRKKNSSSVG